MSTNDQHIVEREVEGTLLSLDDEVIRISGAAPFQHPFGELGGDFLPLTKGLERGVDVTYRVVSEEYGRSHILLWQAHGKPMRLDYFVREGR